MYLNKEIKFIMIVYNLFNEWNVIFNKIGNVYFELFKR